MDKLTAIDAGFLYSESPRMPMHVGALQIYDASTAPGGKVSLERIVDNVRRRAHRISCYHRKLVEVPGRLDHPYWVDDATFDPAEHVREVALARPGNWLALCELIGRLHAAPLERSRPLWEMHVITGLHGIENVPPGGYAVFTKIHHAAVDGVAGIGVTAALHDLTPTVPRTEALPVEPILSEQPAPTELIRRAMVNQSMRPFRWLNAVTRIGPASSSSAWIAPAPRTRFDRPLRENRVFDALHLSVDALKAARSAVPGATVNDVVLAIVGGGLRRYLVASSRLPGTSLTAMVPISMHKEVGEVREGNQISQMIVPLGTEIADPLERLARLRRATAAAKRASGQVDSELLSEIAESTPASWSALGAWNAVHRQGNPPFNTVVTNVMGPSIPLYSCGAKLVRAYGAGPLSDGVGLFHTALSYCGELTLSVTSCAALLPDIAFYMTCLRAAYEDLRATEA